jgi:hypothetical protein
MRAPSRWPRVLGQDQRGALVRASGLLPRHVQLGGGDQPAVADGAADEHRAAPGGVGGLVLAHPGGVPVLLPERQLPARGVGRHPALEQCPVLDKGVRRPVVPGEHLVARTRGRRLQRREPVLVRREQRVAAGLLQGAGPPVPQAKPRPAAPGPGSSTSAISDERPAAAASRALLEEGAADALTAVPGVHRQVDVDDGRVVRSGNSSRRAPTTASPPTAARWVPSCEPPGSRRRRPRATWSLAGRGGSSGRSARWLAAHTSHHAGKCSSSGPVSTMRTVSFYRRPQRSSPRQDVPAGNAVEGRARRHSRGNASGVDDPVGRAGGLLMSQRPRAGARPIGGHPGVPRASSCPRAAHPGRSLASARPPVDEPSQRPTVPVPNSVVTEHEVAGAGDLGQVQRDRVVGAQHSAGALQRVLAQGAGRLRFAQPDQGAGQGGRRPQGGRLVGAQYPAAALQGVLAQGAGRLRFAQPDQGAGQGGRRPQGGRWSGPSTRRQRCRVSSPRARAGSASPSWTRARVRAPAAVRVVGWSGPSTRRQRCRVSSPGRGRSGLAQLASAG